MKLKFGDWVVVVALVLVVIVCFYTVILGG